MWGDIPVYAQTINRLERLGRLPAGYFAAGVVLADRWDPQSLIHLLNSLYGGTFRDEPFRFETGARTFTFFGNGANDAHEICDALRDSWLHRSERDYNLIPTCGFNGDTVQDFVETLIFVGYSSETSYAHNFRYYLIVAPDDSALNDVRAAVALFGASIDEGKRNA